MGNDDGEHMIARAQQMNMHTDQRLQHFVHYLSRNATQLGIVWFKKIYMHHAPRLTLVLISVIFLPFFFFPPACFFGASSSPRDIACT
jgi:hypothetical protein